MVSSIELCNSLKPFLLQMSDIVKEFEDRDIFAPQHWIKWLKDVDAVLKRLQLVESSKIASLYSEILSVQQESSGIGKKRMVFSKCIETIPSAQSIILELYSIQNTKIENCIDILRHIVVPMKNAGLFDDVDTTVSDFPRDFIRQLLKNEQLAPSVNNVIASVGFSDALHLLTEEILGDM